MTGPRAAMVTAIISAGLLVGIGCATSRNYRLGREAEMSGKVYLSYDYYSKALMEHPDDKTVTSALKRVAPTAAIYWDSEARIAWSQGRYAEAWRMAMRCLEIQPDHRSMIVLVNRLEKLHPRRVAAARQEWLRRGHRALTTAFPVEQPTVTNNPIKTDVTQIASNDQGRRNRVPPSSASQLPHRNKPVASPQHPIPQRTSIPRSSTSKPAPASTLRSQSIPSTPPLGREKHAKIQAARRVAAPPTRAQSTTVTPGTHADPKSPTKAPTPRTETRLDIPLQSTSALQFAKNNTATVNHSTQAPLTSQPHKITPRKPKSTGVSPTTQPVGPSKAEPVTAKHPPRQIPAAVSVKQKNPSATDSKNRLSDFPIVRILSKRDRRFQQKILAIDGIYIELKDTDRKPDVDLDLFEANRRVQKIRDLKVGRSKMFRGRSGKWYRLTILRIYHDTHTAWIGIKPA